MRQIRKEGYQFWVNGVARLAFTHPNGWEFENPDGINYINTYSGRKRPGVLFEGWNILRLLEETKDLEEAKESIRKEIKDVEKINEELLVEES